MQNFSNQKQNFTNRKKRKVLFEVLRLQRNSDNLLAQIKLLNGSGSLPTPSTLPPTPGPPEPSPAPSPAVQPTPPAPSNPSQIIIQAMFPTNTATSKVSQVLQTMKTSIQSTDTTPKYLRWKSALQAGLDNMGTDKELFKQIFDNKGETDKFTDTFADILLPSIQSGNQSIVKFMKTLGADDESMQSDLLKKFVAMIFESVQNSSKQSTASSNYQTLMFYTSAQCARVPLLPTETTLLGKSGNPINLEQLMQEAKDSDYEANCKINMLLKYILRVLSNGVFNKRNFQSNKNQTGESYNGGYSLVKPIPNNFKDQTPIKEKYGEQPELTRDSQIQNVWFEDLKVFLGKNEENGEDKFGDVIPEKYGRYEPGNVSKCKEILDMYFGDCLIAVHDQTFNVENPYLEIAQKNDSIYSGRNNPKIATQFEDKLAAELRKLDLPVVSEEQPFSKILDVFFTVYTDGYYQTFCHSLMSDTSGNPKGVIPIYLVRLMFVIWFIYKMHSIQAQYCRKLFKEGTMDSKITTGAINKYFTIFENDKEEHSLEYVRQQLIAVSSDFLYQSINEPDFFSQIPTLLFDDRSIFQNKQNNAGYQFEEEEDFKFAGTTPAVAFAHLQKHFWKEMYQVMNTTNYSTEKEVKVFEIFWSITKTKADRQQEWGSNDEITKMSDSQEVNNAAIYSYWPLPLALGPSPLPTASTSLSSHFISLFNKHRL